MKRLVALAFLLVPLLAFGQGRVPAYSVAVETDYFSNIDLSTTNSLYRTNLTARYQLSLQHLADWVDDNWAPLLDTSSWVVLAPTNPSAQATFNFLDSWFAGLGGTNGFLKGTNIVGASFSNGQWAVDSQTANLLPGQTIEGYTYNAATSNWVADAGTGATITSYETKTASFSASNSVFYFCTPDAGATNVVSLPEIASTDVGPIVGLRLSSAADGRALSVIGYGDETIENGVVGDTILVNTSMLSLYFTWDGSKWRIL